jgi:hypothetical protein
MNRFARSPAGTFDAKELCNRRWGVLTTFAPKPGELEICFSSSLDVIPDTADRPHTSVLIYKDGSIYVDAEALRHRSETATVAILTTTATTIPGIPKLG